MAINKNHEFEDLDGVKCAIAEKNASRERVAFLKELLELNNFKVIVVPSPPPKAAPAPKPVEARPDDPVGRGETTPVVEAPTAPESFTVGVTNVSFNPTNALFGRMLRTRDGHIVTPAYWEQKDAVSHDDIPYFE